jgi:hypothetical protein
MQGWLSCSTFLVARDRWADRGLRDLAETGTPLVLDFGGLVS